MKKIFIAFAALTLSFASCKEKTNEPMETDTIVESDTIVTEEPDTSAVPMDSIAMQKAWEAYMTPGEPHKMMASEEGKWNNEMTFWMSPDGKPEKQTSTAEIKMIMGGRYQKGTYKGDMMGMPFEGLSTLAYDNTIHEYISTWIDNMGTGMMIMRGKYDEASKSSTMKGSVVDPMTGKEKQMREVYTIVDENTRKMEMFDQAPDGSEYKSMEIIMKRA